MNTVASYGAKETTVQFNHHLPSRRDVLFGVAGCAIAATSAQAQSSGKPLKLDIPYVPTPQEVVDRMLQLANITSSDFVMDLGCGDGRMLVTAAQRYGARGFGVDLNPVRIKEANENATKAKVADKVRFEIKNLFDTPIERASVLTMYLLPDVNLKLRPRILDDMKPGSRIVSHDFHMDDWKPDHQETIVDHDVFFWIVPAKVEGNWTLRASGETFAMNIRQRFQQIEGTIAAGKLEGKIREGRIEGTRIRFNAVFSDGSTRIFSGEIQDGKMVFSAANTPRIVEDWTAQREK